MTTAAPGDWVVYLRKSNGRKGIRQQRTLTTAHVEKRLGGRVVSEVTDKDSTAFRKIDGAQPEREGFARMLAMLRETPGLGVAAWHADRLTRNDEDTAALVRVCSSGGHLIETQSGGSYDLSTANGRRRLRDDASAAIYEVDHGTERVLEGRAVVAADGRWLGGKRPFGWEPDPDPRLPDGTPWLNDDGELMKGVLRLRQREAGALKQGHLDVLDGRSLASVARTWNAQGISTYSGKQWRPAEVGRVLRRPRNAGLMEHNGLITVATWPPVVEEKTWRAVVAVLGDSSRRTTTGPARRHLLSFIATCGVCGGPVFCTSTSGKGRTRRQVYRCREDTRGHVARDKAAVDDLVTRLVIGVFEDPETAPLLVRHRERADVTPLYQEAAAIRALMVSRNRMHLAREITDAEFTEGRAQLQQELAEVEARITEAEKADVLAPMRRNPAEVWASFDVDQRRAVVGALMTVTILPTSSGRPEGWKPGQPYFRPESVRIEWKQ